MADVASLLNWRNACPFGELSGVFPVNTVSTLAQKIINFSSSALVKVIWSLRRYLAFTELLCFLDVTALCATHSHVRIFAQWTWGTCKVVYWTTIIEIFIRSKVNHNLSRFIPYLLKHLNQLAPVCVSHAQLFPTHHKVSKTKKLPSNLPSDGWCSFFSVSVLGHSQDVGALYASGWELCQMLRVSAKFDRCVLGQLARTRTRSPNDAR